MGFMVNESLIPADSSRLESGAGRFVDFWSRVNEPRSPKANKLEMSKVVRTKRAVPSKCESYPSIITNG